jgi:hypothetical protein
MSQNVGVDANKLITLAAKLVGIFGVGQALQPQDVQDLFDLLNMMLGEWSENRLNVFHLIDVNFPCDGSLSYTVGPSGKVNSIYPIRLESAYFTNNGVNYPLRIIHAKEDFVRIQLPTLTSFPEYIFLDTNWPLANVSIWPVPNNSYSVTMQMMAQLAAFNNLTDQVNLRPVYQNALMYNLAVRGGPVFGKTVPQDIKDLAKSTKRQMQKANTQIPLLQIDRELIRRGHDNIYTDRSI